MISITAQHRPRCLLSLAIQWFRFTIFIVTPSCLYLFLSRPLQLMHFADVTRDLCYVMPLESEHVAHCWGVRVNLLRMITLGDYGLPATVCVQLIRFL